MDTSISCLIKASTKYDFDFECCLLIIRLKKVFPKIGPNLNEWTFHSQAQYSPFVVIGNEQRGINRFNSLLALFKLQSHLISERNLSILPLREYQNIDFDTVNLVLSEYRKRSMNFLMTNCINC